MTMTAFLLALPVSLAAVLSPQAADAPQPNRPVEVVSPKGSYPDDPRLDIALEMLRKSSFEPAATTARTVIKERPEVERAHAILGIALNKLKRYEEARVALELASKSTQGFPEQRHAAHFLGWSCYHLGELEAARAAFDAHLKSVPGEPDSTFGLGLIALTEDRLDDSERLFAEALRGFTEPRARPADQARVLTRMADLALRRDDLPKAEELLERAIRATPMQHETWSKLARVKDRLGKTAEADTARANGDRLLQAMGRKTPADAAPSGAAPASPVVPAGDSAAPRGPEKP